MAGDWWRHRRPARLVPRPPERFVLHQSRRWHGAGELFFDYATGIWNRGANQCRIQRVILPTAGAAADKLYSRDRGQRDDPGHRGRAARSRSVQCELL